MVMRFEPLFQMFQHFLENIFYFFSRSSGTSGTVVHAACLLGEK